MLDDLRLLLAHAPVHASRAEYASAVVDGNVLGKPTRKARELALRHMATLYALDLTNPIFRALRHLWSLNEAAQPLLALAVALARDPLLRGTRPFILAQVTGVAVQRKSMEAFLSATHPDRFSPASLKSFAQNVAGTWTAAGLLTGHRRKLRSLPAKRPESLALLLAPFMIVSAMLAGQHAMRATSNALDTPFMPTDTNPDLLEIVSTDQHEILEGSGTSGSPVTRRRIPVMLSARASTRTPCFTCTERSMDMARSLGAARPHQHTRLRG